MHYGMRVMSAHQPHYLPFMGTWYKYLSSDVFVWLDSVQYSNNSWLNRNRLRNAEGWQWLTLPVKSHIGMLIKDVPLVDTRWVVKHKKTLQNLYGRTQFKELLAELLATYDSLLGAEMLCDVIYALDGFVKKEFSQHPEEVLSSKFVLEQDADDRLISLCKQVDCKVYLSGPSGLVYMNRDKWEKAGIKVLFSDLNMKEYKQLFTGFEKNMSFVDTLFNVNDIEGFTRSCGIITQEW